MQTQGAAACGMCIEVLAVDNMPALNDQLTKWDYKKNITVPFIAMIFDQCTDPICEWNGYLDFVSAILWSTALYVPQWHAHHQPLLSGVSIRPHERLTLEFMLFVSNECANRTCTARSSRWPRVRPRIPHHVSMHFHFQFWPKLKVPLGLMEWHRQASALISARINCPMRC